MSSLYIFFTIISAFSFLFLFVIEEFKECHIYIWYLLLSSIAYKAIYMLSHDKSSIYVVLINKIDYICIFNLLWCHSLKYFDTVPISGITQYFYYFTIAMSIINYKVFHFIVLLLYLNTWSHLYETDKYLVLFYTISIIFIALSYYSYFVNGWNLINSWNWHLAICTCLLSVKMSYLKSDKFLNN